MSTTLKIGYIPEHFSTPLQFAITKNFFESLNIELVCIPGGSGDLIKQLTSEDIDIAIGLTEAFVRGIANGSDAYKIVGSYVDSPLCWSVSTGINRSEPFTKDLKALQDGKIGVSRIGSGSYVMSFVLGLQNQLISPYYKDFVVCGDFKNLRDSVNKGTSDIFMWEYFTSKKYYANKEIKQIGEIYTPWPSWVIVSNVNVDSQVVNRFLNGVNKGIEYFNNHHDEAVDYIANNLDYSKEDAQEWLKTVKFAKDSKNINWGTVVKKTFEVLKTANVLDEKNDDVVLSRLEKFIVRPN